MELSLLLAEKILSMALMGVVGYAIVRIGLFQAEDSGMLSKLIVYVISPCVIVNAFQIDYSASKVRGLLLAILAAVIIHVVLIGATSLLSRPLHFNNIEQASLIYSNCGNLIIPLVQGVLGAEWVFYTCGYSIVQTIMIWTHGTSVICKGEKSGLKKILLNPNVIATVVGLVMFFGKLHFPSVISDCMTGFGSMIGPGSMVVIGMLMGKVDLKWLFGQKRPYLICFLRLVFLPAVAAVIFRFSGMLKLHEQAETILLISLLAGMAPVAAMVTQIAQVYHQDAVYASAINVMTIIFCIVTMPLMVLFYQWLLLL
ncbi:MAG: AEC family transporter [Hespellia sp.]|nr:AEC family transporter [Hespellia sp.]